MNSFERRPETQFGTVGESQIASYIKYKTGAAILPVYEKELDTGKGPRIFAAEGGIVAPDMIVLPGTDTWYWVEAKHKSVFTWHRKSRTWQTGIDAHHWENYLAVRYQFGHAVYLAFLHRCSKPDARDLEWGCPPTCPTGLFVGEIDYLEGKIDHPHDGHGRHGMVYWAVDVLVCKATLEEVNEAVEAMRGAMGKDAPCV